MTNTEQNLWLILAQAISGQETSLADFDDDKILEQANLHGIPQLLNSQVQAGTLSGVGDGLIEQLKSESFRSAAFDMTMNAATCKTLDLLAEREIPALLLKGTPVAHLYYPATYLRTRCDTDIYIREHDLEKAIAVLSGDDYHISKSENREISSKQFVAAMPSAQNSYIHFDVHWKLSNRVMFQHTLPFDECLETSQPVPSLGPNAMALSKTDLLIHACIHRIAHGRNTQRNRLIWLYDIHLVFEAMDELEKSDFLAAARQKEVATLCADALEVCHATLGTAVPDGYIKEMKEGSEKEPSAKLIGSSKLRWAWEDMQSLGSLSEKIAFARELLFDR